MGDLSEIQSSKKDGTFVVNKNPNFGVDNTSAVSKRIAYLKKLESVASLDDKTRTELTNERRNLEKDLQTSKSETLLDDLKNARNKMGLYDNAQDLNKYFFNRFAVYNNMDFATNTHAYVFFTRPDIEIANFYLYPNEYELREDVLSLLTSPGYNKVMVDPNISVKDKITSITDGSAYMQNGPFIPLLTNMASNFDAQDVVIKTDDTNKTKRGIQLSSATGYDDSISGGEFTVNYPELSNYEITWLHSYWVEYMQQVKYNKFTAKQYNRYNFYLDYAVSAYFFYLDMDAMTIKYYSRYVGVFPMNKPFSVFNWDRGETKTIKVGIQYHYNLKEDNDLQILKDFNALSGVPTNSSDLQLLMKKYGTNINSTKVASNGGKNISEYGRSGVNMSENWGTQPFIYIDPVTYRHKLFFNRLDM